MTWHGCLSSTVRLNNSAIQRGIHQNRETRRGKKKTWPLRYLAIGPPEFRHSHAVLRFPWHPPIGTKLVYRGRNHVRTMPFNKIRITTSLSISSEIFAVGAHRAAFGNSHSRLVVGWIGRLRHGNVCTSRLTDRQELYIYSPELFPRRI